LNTSRHGGLVYGWALTLAPDEMFLKKRLLIQMCGHMFSKDNITN